MNACDPIDNVDVVYAACPVESSGTLATAMLPSRNVTLPVGTADAPPTDAENVTAASDDDGFGDDVNVVEVVRLAAP